MKKLLLSTFFLLCCLFNIAQIIPQELITRVNNSAYIFEGKVIRSNSYFTQDHKMIYTSSTIDIYKIFKGNLTCGTIEVITRGGCVGDECLYITDNLILKKDMLGVFMCNLTSKELSATDFFPETNVLKLDLPYEIQGYIKYFEDNFNKQIVDYQYSLDSLAQVYNLMELYTQLNYIDCHGSLISGNISQQKTKTIRDPNQEAKEFLSGISIERAQNDTILNYTLMNP